MNGWRWLQGWVLAMRLIETAGYFFCTSKRLNRRERFRIREGEPEGRTPWMVFVTDSPAGEKGIFRTRINISKQAKLNIKYVRIIHPVNTPVAGMARSNNNYRKPVT
ncbi:MAG TPA: hypothetical protein VFY78_13045 [Gammaproteobacteria bacterium]|nr:hypothetical protein [Gammaproteobacteria bacterium]